MSERQIDLDGSTHRDYIKPTAVEAPSDFYEELAKSILASYEGRKFDKQELLSRFLPVEEKERCVVERDWGVYNAAQTREKVLFLKIVFDVLESLREPASPVENGRPPKDVYDIVKALIIKTYANLSSRRVVSELKIAKALGYVDDVPHFNSLSNYLKDEDITLLLHKVYTLMAEPLKEVETHFAVDATGFSTFNKKRWVEVRLEHQQHAQYRKLHAICGVRTNVITRAIITQGTTADTTQYEELLRETCKIFNVKEVSADAGYLSKNNAQVSEDLGAIPYIMPKKNTIGLAKGHYPAWNKMIWLWKTNQSLFKSFYHQRSNIESTFSSLKRKFGSYVRSKTPTAQENEILLKIICYNATILIKALMELDISVKFLEVEQKPKLPSVLC